MWMAINRLPIGMSANATSIRVDLHQCDSTNLAWSRVDIRIERATTPESGMKPGTQLVLVPTALVPDCGGGGGLVSEHWPVAGWRDAERRSDSAGRVGVSGAEARRGRALFVSQAGGLRGLPADHGRSRPAPPLARAHVLRCEDGGFTDIMSMSRKAECLPAV